MYANDTVYGITDLLISKKGSNVKLMQTRQEEKKVDKYLSKELLQKTEDRFQQTQILPDLGKKRKQCREPE